MTPERTNSTSVLQHSSALPSQPQFGRRAYGSQRRTSQATLVRNIVESILHHRALGIERDPSFYTPNPNMQALVQAKLDALAMAAHEVMQPGERYRRVSP